MMLNNKYARIMRIVWRWTRILFLEALMLGTVVLALLAPFSLLLLHDYHRFSPIQKYWFVTYWRAEFPRHEQSTYRVLLVEAANGQKWIAGPEDVAPGRTRSADGTEIPFALTTTREHEGVRLVLEPPALTPNQYLYDSLRDQIYDGESITEMGGLGIDLGWKLVFLTCLYWFVRGLYVLFEWYVLRPLRDDQPKYTYVPQADWLAAKATEPRQEGTSHEN